MPLCSAGIEGATFLDVTVAASVFGEAPASLRIAGMKDLADGTSAHVYWLEEFPLSCGDVLRISPSDLVRATDPISIVPTDSPEYVEEQRLYEEFLGAHVWPQPQPVKSRDNVCFGLTAPGFPGVRAGLSIGHEHLLCGVSWNVWRPERSRVSVRSFARESKLQWLSGQIPIGESLCVEVRV